MRRLTLFERPALALQEVHKFLRHGLFRVGRGCLHWMYPLAEPHRVRSHAEWRPSWCTRVPRRLTALRRQLLGTFAGRFVLRRNRSPCGKAHGLRVQKVAQGARQSIPARVVQHIHNVHGQLNCVLGKDAGTEVMVLNQRGDRRRMQIRQRVQPIPGIDAGGCALGE